jgi:type IV pilus assembly protein PilF
VNNFWRKIFFSVILSGILSACTTTYDAPKFTSSSASDAPAQSADAKKRASLRLQLGVSYFQQAQFATALKELTNAIAIDPTLSDAYGVRALVYMQMQETTLAEQDFLRVMQLAPNNPDHANNYAWFLCENGKVKQGLEVLDRVIKDRTYAQPTKALNNAGMCSLKIKDDVMAEKYFMQAVRLDANNPISNLNLSQIAYKKQDWAHAQFYINRLIKTENYTAEILWLAIRASHKMNDTISESSLGAQLHRRFPDSDEFALFQRGAFDE